MTGHPVFAKIFSLFFNNFQVPDEILNDESIETTMKSKTDDEVKFEDEDEIETTMLPMIDDDMVSTLISLINVEARLLILKKKFHPPRTFPPSTFIDFLDFFHPPLHVYCIYVQGVSTRSAPNKTLIMPSKMHF